jgi:ADP-ribose pyrophosphatase YjhB (NUDIX family)
MKVPAAANTFWREEFCAHKHTNIMIHPVAASLLAGAVTASAFRPSRQYFRSPNSALRRSSTSGPWRIFGLSSASQSSGPAHCEKCGTPTGLRIPEGDERARRVCENPECGHVHYRNPKVVVGAICTREDRVLLCKRAIEPCIGRWGYPQGYLELGETTRQGAAREAREEAGVVFDPASSELIAIYNLAGVQIQMIFRVELESADFKAGPESSDVKFVAWADIPWDDLAFPTVTWGLEYARAVKDEVNPAVQERTKLVTADGQWTVVEEGRNTIPGREGANSRKIAPQN